MTKEEQMKAIGDIIAKIIKRDCVSIFDEDDDGEVEMISTISVNGIGKAIYECGYRKAEEVRKETAREILDKILKVIEFEASLDDKNATFNLCSEVVKDVIGEYGVDVGDSEEFDGPDTNDPTQFPACGDDMIGF